MYSSIMLYTFDTENFSGQVQSYRRIKYKTKVMQKFTKATALLVLSIALICTAGCKKHNAGNGTYKGHDYIDLGLPSGTMWATCNVGAESPINTVITLLGARPHRKTSIIGAPINTAMATITCSQSIVANRISASTASLMT